MGGNGNAGMSSGLDMFSQIFDMANNSNRTNTSETDSNIIVSSVEVSIGQQVEVGDILYFLEETGVSELAEELESNVMKAKADLDALIADQNLSKSTADYTYQTSLAYGAYAKEEYQSTISQLQLTVTEKENALEKAKTSLLRYEEQLSQANTDYQNAYQIQLNCEWSRDNTNKNDSTYLYVTYFQEAMSAKATADSLAQKIEQLENTITQAKANVETSTTELAKAKRSLEAGILSATQTLSLRQLAYDTAQETLDIALSYLTEDLISQEEIYQEASDKWNEFTSHIDGNAIKAKYSGIITNADLSVGDAVASNSTIITLYDMDEISMSVSLAEDDMEDISLGSKANVTFTAYPNDVYTASVSEISDATTDSSGNVTYTVTIVLEGDVSGLFQGMTGEITFITKDTEDVIFVSNRAIIRESNQSYVKVKDDNGKIQKVLVTTGFSDGINVEIIEGLSVGDIVLIESKVNN